MEESQLELIKGLIIELSESLKDLNNRLQVLEENSKLEKASFSEMISMVKLFIEHPELMQRDNPHFEKL